MEQDPLENKEIKSDTEKAIDMLERPVDGDFVAGLRSFIDWIQGLVKK